MKLQINLLTALSKAPEAAISLATIRRTIFYLALFFVVSYTLSMLEVRHIKRELATVEGQLDKQRAAFEKLKAQTPSADESLNLTNKIALLTQEISQQETLMLNIKNNKLSNAGIYISLMNDFGYASIPQVQLVSFVLNQNGGFIQLGGLGLTGTDVIHYFQNLKNYPEFKDKKFNDIELKTTPKGVNFLVSTSK